MKIIKTASGKKTIKMSKKEWEAIGKKAGWDLPDPSWHGGPSYTPFNIEDVEKQIKNILLLVDGEEDDAQLFEDIKDRLEYNDDEVSDDDVNEAINSAIEENREHYRRIK